MSRIQWKFDRILFFLLMAPVGCAQDPFGLGIGDDANEVQGREALANSDPAGPLVACINSFAVETLAKAIHANEQDPTANIVFSPLNLFRLLFLMHEGSSGASKAALSNCLNLERYPGVNPEMLRHLLVEEGNKVLASGIEVNSALAVWADKEFPLSKPLRAQMEEKFLGLAAELDFSRAVETADYMNAWVRGFTRTQMEPVITPDMLQRSRLVAVSALAMKAKWSQPFAPKELYLESVQHNGIVGEGWLANTTPAPFHREDRSVLNVHMMHHEFELRVSRDIYDVDPIAVEKDLAGHDFAMVFVLPPMGRNITSLFQGEPGSRPVEDMIQMKDADVRNVDLYLPWFFFSSRFDEPFFRGSLGLDELYRLSADWVGFSPALGAASVSHLGEQAFIQVGEAGVEAWDMIQAGVDPFGSSNPTWHDTITINRPCCFFILDKASRLILFAGALKSPPEVILR